jgi:hypothetical protein
LIQEWREEIPSRIPCGSISTCAKIQRITSRPRAVTRVTYFTRTYTRASEFDGGELSV